MNGDNYTQSNLNRLSQELEEGEIALLEGQENFQPSYYNQQSISSPPNRLNMELLESLN